MVVRQGLKGLAPSLFHDAARKAGAATVVMV
jgi:hypothetical protein